MKLKNIFKKKISKFFIAIGVLFGGLISIFSGVNSKAFDITSDSITNNVVETSLSYCEVTGVNLVVYLYRDGSLYTCVLNNSSTVIDFHLYYTNTIDFVLHNFAKALNNNQFILFDEVQTLLTFVDVSEQRLILRFSSSESDYNGEYILESFDLIKASNSFMRFNLRYSNPFGDIPMIKLLSDEISTFYFDENLNSIQYNYWSLQNKLNDSQATWLQGPNYFYLFLNSYKSDNSIKLTFETLAFSSYNNLVFDSNIFDDLDILYSFRFIYVTNNYLLMNFDVIDTLFNNDFINVNDSGNNDDSVYLANYGLWAYVDYMNYTINNINVDVPNKDTDEWTFNDLEYHDFVSSGGYFNGSVDDSIYNPNYYAPKFTFYFDSIPISNFELFFDNFNKCDVILIDSDSNAINFSVNGVFTLTLDYIYSLNSNFGNYVTDMVISYNNADSVGSIYSNLGYSRGFSNGYNYAFYSNNGIINELTEENDLLKNANDDLFNRVISMQTSIDNLTRSYNDLNVSYQNLLNGNNFANLFFTIAETPFASFKQIWNVDFLGVNLAGFVTGIIFIGLLIWLVKKIF